jgi:hypothetical protein
MVKMQFAGVEHQTRGVVRRQPSVEIATENGVSQMLAVDT